jgi:anthranilate synthase component 1
VAGSSPESTVKLANGRISIRPIAGTRRRGGSDAEDLRLECELRESRKERAEHAMLVDLARNDLSRVAAPASVRVRELARVERFSHVMHLVSDVEATAPIDCTPADVIRATIPAGTVSGAPKIRAMQLIDEYESTRRNLYGGCLGYIGRSGAMDMALVIRSVVRANHRTSIRAGAGIVAGSTPEGELAECRSKLAALQQAIEMAARMQSNTRQPANIPSASPPSQGALGVSTWYS